MDDEIDPASHFEEHRDHLRAVAYRMLGSLSEADDAVQEAWLRLARADTSGVENRRAWLTTVVARICLDMLRARTARREEPLDVHVPDPIVRPMPGGGRRDDPEEDALLTDSVGLALLVVLDTLSPTERLAFVLHDVFGVPFEQIGRLLERSPAAAKQLASRARRRVRGATSNATIDARRQGEIVDAFLKASQAGDFDGLIRGAPAVIAQARRFASLARFARRVLVNGTPGLLAVRDGQPLALLSFAIRVDSITEIDILADPARLAQVLTDVTG